MPKLTINKLNIASIFFLLFLISLFFPIRYVLPTPSAYQTGAYSDFTSVSLYLSDIFLFLTVIFTIPPRGGKFWSSIKDKRLLIFITWLIIALIADFNYISVLNWWFFAKYLELIVAYETTFYLFAKTKIKALFISTFVVFASLESILALWQFMVQHSVGGLVHKLGEQVLGPKIIGVAKIVSGGTTLIRGYGTFPHPNLLSAFLVTSIFLCLYLFISAKTTKGKLLYAMGLLINTLGLTVTFSRAGFLALAVGLVVFFAYLLWTMDSQTKKTTLSALAITGLSLLLCLAFFRPYLATRATITDDAALERIFYAKIGLKMIEQHPIFGVGIGDSVLHMQQYLPALNFDDQVKIIKTQSGNNQTQFAENLKKFMASQPIKLFPWQIQPIHNYFLLAAAELGIPGALILIWIFLQHAWLLTKKLKSKASPESTIYYLLLATILGSFLVLMQFDHYFYTLQQTQMLLWIILGVISSATKNPRQGD